VTTDANLINYSRDQYGNLEGLSGYIRLFEGDTEITTGLTYDIVEGTVAHLGNWRKYDSNNLFFLIETTTGEFTAAAVSDVSWTSAIESANYEITHSTYGTFTKKLTVNKVPAGADGASGTVNLSGGQVIEDDTTNQYAGWIWNSNGIEYAKGTSTGTGANRGNWLLSGAAAGSHDIKVVKTGGNATVTGMTLGSWLSLGTTRTCRIDDIADDGKTQIAILSVSVQNTTTGIVQDSNIYYLSANKSTD